MTDDKITWRPIDADTPNRKLLLYSPPENITGNPDDEPDFRVSRPRDFCWATLWMEIKQPIKAAPMAKRTTT